ncbi:unnamed protein product [Sphagnum jensenii]|uniref:WRKY domain-containing protein n=1 Tax=Sphagnum jensenii TaxID=128206 RepID=A0ABP1BJ55_9BRYO
MDVLHGCFSASVIRKIGAAERDLVSVQCVDKVQEMLGRAIKDQQDLLDIFESAAASSHEMQQEEEARQLLDVAGSCWNTSSTCTSTTSESSTLLTSLTRAKLENSLDWCHLALCRLTEIFGQSPAPPASAAARSVTTRQASCRYPGRRMNDHKSQQQLEPDFFDLKFEDRLDSRLLTSNGGGRSLKTKRGYHRSLDKSLNMLDSDLEPSREETFEWIHKTVMDAELPDDNQAAARDMKIVTPEIHEPSKSVIRQAAAASTAPPAAARVNLSAIKDIKMQGASAAGDDHIPQVEDHDHADQQRQINDSSFMSRRNPNIRAWKRDIQAAGSNAEEQNQAPVILYQHLRPGESSKKGIPEDGHPWWKKYGSKNIYNASFSRAYYKCSVMDCRAKKMVQPTDKDPSVFQVIYVGVHTCSHTANTRKRKRNVSRGGAVQAAADKAASLQQFPSREEQDHHESPMKPTTAPPMRSVLQHQTDQQPATTHVATDDQGGQPEITSQLAASAMHDFDEVELGGLETLEDKDFFPLIKLPAPSASSSPVHHHHHHELRVEDRVVADNELLMGYVMSDFPPCSWLDFVSDPFGPPEITNSDMAESFQDSV